MNQINQDKDEDYAFTVPNSKLLTMKCSIGGVNMWLVEHQLTL